MSIPELTPDQPEVVPQTSGVMFGDPEFRAAVQRGIDRANHDFAHPDEQVLPSPRVLQDFGRVVTTPDVQTSGLTEVPTEEKIPDGPRQLPQAAIDAVAAARANRPDISEQPQTQTPGYVTHALRGLVIDDRRRGKR